MDRTKQQVIDSLRKGVTKIIHPWSRITEATLSEDVKISQHQAVEFLYVIHGTCDFFFNNSILTIRPGDMIIIDSFIHHSMGYSKHDHDLIHLWGCLTEDDFYTNIYSIKQPGTGGFLIPLSYQPLPIPLKTLFENRMNALKDLPKITNEYVDAYLRAICNMMLDEAAFTLEHGPEKRNHHVLSSKIKAFVRSTNGKNCSLASLEHLCGLSRYYISHCFQQDTGTTIGEYINTVRLNFTLTARKRGMRYKEIAAELGFASLNSFWNWKRQYKEYFTNQSPTHPPESK
jgi:AraC-like DNA-binding protein